MSAGTEPDTPGIYADLDNFKVEVKENFHIMEERVNGRFNSIDARLDTLTTLIQSIISGTIPGPIQSTGIIHSSGILHSTGTITTGIIPGSIGTPISMSQSQPAVDAQPDIRAHSINNMEYLQDTNRHRRDDISTSSEYEQPNFRHINQNPSEAPTPNRGVDDIFDDLFLNRRMTTLSSGSLLNTAGAMVRAVTNIDPTLSGVQLSYLDIPHFVSWINDMKHLQKKHPHEELDWALFVTESVALQIDAYNHAKNFIRRTVIHGNTIVLPTRDLIKLIFKIIQPTSKSEYMDEFDRSVKFGKLYNNEHMSEVDPSKYDNWYKGIITYIHKAVDMVILLSQDPDNNHIPSFKTVNGNKGLLQHFFEGIPQGLGKSIHDTIDSNAVKNCCNLNTAAAFTEYTRLFQKESQVFLLQQWQLQ